LRGTYGASVALAPDGQEPIVLVFLDDWSLRDEEDSVLEPLRAQLRILGAVLVALSNNSLWCFRPRAETQTFATSVELDPVDVAALRAAYGVGREGVVLGLFVIDADNVVRFAHVGAARDFRDAGDVLLLAALSAAGRASLVPRPRAGLVSRQEVAAACLVVGFAVVVLEASEAALPSLRPGPVSGVFASGPVPLGEVDLTFELNGDVRALRVTADASLLDALRERLGLTGMKKACEHGQCGACAVLLDGRRANACSTPAITAQGTKITTIEGLARGAELHRSRASEGQG
jgi:hypothetical protein